MKTKKKKKKPCLKAIREFRSSEHELTVLLVWSPAGKCYTFLHQGWLIGFAVHQVSRIQVQFNNDFILKVTSWLHDSCWSSSP